MEGRSIGVMRRLIGCRAVSSQVGPSVAPVQRRGLSTPQLSMRRPCAPSMVVPWATVQPAGPKVRNIVALRGMASGAGEAGASEAVPPPPPPEHRQSAPPAERTPRPLRSTRSAGASVHSFASLGVPPALLGKLPRLGKLQTPSVVQVAMLPHAFPEERRHASPPTARRDMVVHAQTGSGKTLAYALPMLASVGDPRERKLRGVVVVPTRELALQVTRVLAALAEHGSKRARAGRAPVVVRRLVGRATDRLRASLRADPPHIVVGTPRTLRELVPRHLSLGDLTHLVLDEVDALVAGPQAAHTRELLQRATSVRHRPSVLMVSATSSPEVRKAAEQFLLKPERIDLVTADGTSSLPPSISHYVLPLYAENQRTPMLTRVMAAMRPVGVLAFLNSQAGVPDVLDFLKSKHVKAAELLNSTPVAQRAEAIDGSQQGRINVLLSTDMASRGLDLPRLTHVINVHPPSTGRGYIHRAGRVGRMGRAGACITMVTAEQEPVFRKLARGLNIPLQTLRIEQGRAVVE